MGQPTVSGVLGRLEIKLLRRSRGRASQKTVESSGSFGSPSEAEDDTFNVTVVIRIVWFSPAAALSSPSAVVARLTVELMQV